MELEEVGRTSWQEKGVLSRRRRRSYERREKARRWEHDKSMKMVEGRQETKDTKNALKSKRGRAVRTRTPKAESAS